MLHRNGYKAGYLGVYQLAQARYTLKPFQAKLKVRLGSGYLHLGYFAIVEQAALCYARAAAGAAAAEADIELLPWLVPSGLAVSAPPAAAAMVPGNVLGKTLLGRTCSELQSGTSKCLFPAPRRSLHGLLGGSGCAVAPLRPRALGRSTALQGATRPGTGAAAPLSTLRHGALPLGRRGLVLGRHQGGHWRQVEEGRPRRGQLQDLLRGG